jgi:hypothetical protein
MLRTVLRRPERFLVVQPEPTDGWVIIQEFDTYDQAADWMRPRRGSLNSPRILTESEWARRVIEHMKGN